MRLANSIRTWNYIMSLLNSAQRRWPGNCVEVANEVIINIKYQSRPRGVKGDKEAMQKVVMVYEWLQENDIPVNARTLTNILAVVVTIGSGNDVSNSFALFEKHGISPPLAAFNIRLDQFCKAKDETGARELLQEMQALQLAPDRITYNTLQQLCIQSGNATWSRELLTEMKARGIPLDDRSYSAILHFQRQDKLGQKNAKDILASVPRSALTPFIFTNAINATNHPANAIDILTQAKEINQADYSVYLAAASVCLRQGDRGSAFEILQEMFAEGVEMNQAIMSFIASMCLTNVKEQDNREQRETGSIMSYIRVLLDYLQTTKKTHPQALTSSTMFFILKSLLDMHQPFLAIAMHHQFSPPGKLWPHVLTPVLFAEIEAFRVSSLRERKGLMLMTGSLGDSDDDNALQLTMYDGQVQGNSTIVQQLMRCLERQFRIEEMLFKKYIPIKRAVHTVHLDTVLRLLLSMGQERDVHWLFDLMSGKLHEHFIWTPSGTTLYEFTDFFRRTNDVESSYRLLDWVCSLNRNVLIPETIVNAILSFIYRQGQTERVLELYRKYCAKLKRVPWKTSKNGGPEVDLHFMSKGMAYAVLTTSMQQVAENHLLVNQTTFTIITGQNIELRSNAQLQQLSSSSSSSSSNKLESYRLSDEVQRILIDEFYPPIPSSTEPGNPGRLIVRLDDIRKVHRKQN